MKNLNLLLALSLSLSASAFASEVAPSSIPNPVGNAFVCRIPGMVDSGYSVLVSNNRKDNQEDAVLNQITMRGPDQIGSYPLTKSQKGSKIIFRDTATNGKDFLLVMSGQAMIGGTGTPAKLYADTKAGRINETMHCSLLLRAL